MILKTARDHDLRYKNLNLKLCVDVFTYDGLTKNKKDIKKLFYMII